MISARIAGPGDAEEIVRLRAIMLAEWFDTEGEQPWKTAAVEAVRRRLAEDEPTMGVTVVDARDGSGRLAACAVGTISERLPAPFNPSGRYGWVFNVVTDAEWRRRGYSRACVEALLAWFDGRDVPVVELLATEQGGGLYERLGFTVSPEPAMRRSRR